MNFNKIQKKLKFFLIYTLVQNIGAKTTLTPEGQASLLMCQGDALVWGRLYYREKITSLRPVQSPFFKGPTRSASCSWGVVEGQDLLSECTTLHLACYLIWSRITNQIEFTYGLSGYAVRNLKEKLLAQENRTSTRKNGCQLKPVQVTMSSYRKT